MVLLYKFRTGSNIFPSGFFHFPPILNLLCMKQGSTSKTISWNSLISTSSKAGRHVQVLTLFNKLRRCGLLPNLYTLSSFINSSSHPLQTQLAHSLSLKSGLSLSPFLLSTLLQTYSSFRLTLSAEKCFHDSPFLDSALSSSMITSYIRNTHPSKARLFFSHLLLMDLPFNEFTLTSLLCAISHKPEGDAVHGVSLKKGFLYGSSTCLCNSFMTMYCRSSSRHDAVKMFDEMSSPDVVSFTVRLASASTGFEAMVFFNHMRSVFMEVNELTVVHLLSSIEDRMMLVPGRNIHAFCHNSGYLSSVPVSNSFIFFYGKCGEMGSALQMFEEMSSPDSVSFNSLISCYADNGCIQTAAALISLPRLRLLFVEPSVHTMASLLQLFSSMGGREPVGHIHTQMVKLGFVVDDSMAGCLITAYGRCKCVVESAMVFYEAGDTNLSAWNSIEGVLVSSGLYQDSIILFKNVWRSGREMDGTTLSMVLKACGGLTDMEQGRCIHSLSLKLGFTLDWFVETAIVDVYCKTGSIDDAEKAFLDRDGGGGGDNLASWNAMMMGYAQHGYSDHVFLLFEKMTASCLVPDEITYLAVLSSCCHSGRVEEACGHLNSMISLHRVSPCLEHYACMVDMFGRIGRLDDAKRVIDEMPVMPDAQVWQILLSSCHVHGNVELGEVAAREIMKMQPENDSTYVVLSNLYAMAGMWRSMRLLRKEMKEKVVKKEPGSSCINVHGVLHCFYSMDTSCLENGTLCEVLQMFKGHLGYHHSSVEDGDSSMRGCSGDTCEI